MSKNIGTILAVGGLAVLFAFGQVKKRAVSQLQLRTIRIRAGRLRFDGNRLIVPIIVLNPNSEAIHVNSVVGEAWLNDKKIANVEMFDHVQVLPNDKTTIDLNMRLMALQIVDTVLDMINNKVKVEIGFTGSLNIDNKVTPVHLSYKVL